MGKVRPWFSSARTVVDGDAAACALHVLPLNCYFYIIGALSCPAYLLNLCPVYLTVVVQVVLQTSGSVEILFASLPQAAAMATSSAGTAQMSKTVHIVSSNDHDQWQPSGVVFLRLLWLPFFFLLMHCVHIYGSCTSTALIH